MSSSGGLLLTKRPSDLAMSNFATGPSLACGINNYKGIMLCARPTPSDLPTIQENKRQKHSSSNNEESFICGTVKKPWGSNVVIAEKDRVLKRVSSKDSAICKHKAWLKEMQDKRECAARERADKEHAKKERMREFKSKQAAKRAILLDRENDLSVDPDEGNDIDGNASSRPAWALTEGAAQVAAEDKEAQEEDDLLCFVENLDFDQYDHDLELKILMDQVKERIRTLQKERNIDEARLQAVMDSEVAALRAESLSGGRDDLQIICGENEDSDETSSDDEIMSIAETVRSEGTIGSIHSQRSMQALVARSREKIDSGGNVLQPIRETPIEATMAPPVLITHIEDDGARIAETKSLNKLPFMNRNPAV